MAAVFAGAGSVTAMAETADTAAAETQAESQAAKPAPAEFAHITSCEVTGGNQVSIKGQMEGSWSDPAYYDNYLYLFEMKPYQRPDGLRCMDHKGRRIIVSASAESWNAGRQTVFQFCCSCL